jgi:hypothetical protein
LEVVLQHVLDPQQKFPTEAGMHALIAAKESAANDGCQWIAYSRANVSFLLLFAHWLRHAADFQVLSEQAPRVRALVVRS